ncbi:Hypothetical protein AJAP_31680 [Amycolatopsis japonica]|uniref:Uncharacterized protein n=1 Tax=Amycolatopsis japonica TaxID=208439 RepID=A0A075V8I6_9PSEU|nr:hypothetical protein [Amycolatopsis japonica]AIG79155.1 Hypothetical protein AJAP_31680 [Amycolatopsis japonica]
MTGAGDHRPVEPPRVRSAEASDVDRILDMVYVLARRTGRSPGAAARLCTRLVPELVVSSAGAPDSHGHRLATARHGRVAVATALRARSRRCDPAVFDDALADAVVRDELELLPPRQRFTVWSVAVRHRPIAEVAAETGWSRAQVVRLLNSGLATMTKWSRKSIPFA